MALTSLSQLFVASLCAVACARAESELAARTVSTAAAPSVASAPRVQAAVAPSGVPAPVELLPAPKAEDSSPTALAPLAGVSEEALPVPGFLPAVVSVPVGTTSARPIVVALHGNFDRPEWQCGVWGPLVKARAFVLCLRGVPRRDVPKSMDRWEYLSGKALTNELEAALTALRERFAGYVDPGPMLFIGFSLGSIYGVSLVQKAPERFPRAVMIEGGLGAWTPAKAKQYVAGGGQRLLLACGQLDCMNKVKTLGPSLERAGLPTRSGGSSRAGHTYDGEVADVVARNWDWLVEGDARFAP